MKILYSSYSIFDVWFALIFTVNSFGTLTSAEYVDFIAGVSYKGATDLQAKNWH